MKYAFLISGVVLLGFGLAGFKSLFENTDVVTALMEGEGILEYTLMVYNRITGANLEPVPKHAYSLTKVYYCVYSVFLSGGVASTLWAKKMGAFRRA